MFGWFKKRPTEIAPTATAPQVQISDPESSPELDAQAESCAKIVQLCELAGYHSRIMLDPEEDAEGAARNRASYEKRKNAALDLLATISDDFYRNAALHRLIVMHDKAQEHAEARSLFERVDDDFIRSKILEELPTAGS